MPPRSSLIVPLAALLAGSSITIGAGAAARAQDDAPDPDDLRPGLIAEFSSTTGPGGPGPRVVRVASSPVERWGDGAPDPRLSPGTFTASWSGWLHVRDAGDYRFRMAMSEEFARAGATSVAAGFSCHADMVLPYLVDLCTPEQGKRWLP